jgi:hypothetical protein
MKIALLIFGIVLILGALASIGFCVYNLVKCYRGVRICKAGIIECGEKNQYAPIAEYNRAIAQFKDAIRYYYMTIGIDAFVVILNSLVIYINYL